jgi:hypothetical protein
MTEILRYNHHLYYSLRFQTDLKMKFELQQMQNLYQQHLAIYRMKMQEWYKHRALMVIYSLDKHIAQYLDAKTLVRFGQLGKRWKHLTNDEYLWTAQCKSMGFDPKEMMHVNHSSKEIYQMLILRFRRLLSGKHEQITASPNSIEGRFLQF